MNFKFLRDLRVLRGLKTVLVDGTTLIFFEN
jgi:hypothetical protein